MTEVFDVHKFLYSLFYQKDIKGHSILYINKNNKEELIKIKDLKITSNPLTCKIYDYNDKCHIIILLRIKKIFKNKELVFENTNFNIKDTKIIKGYKK